MHLNFAIIGCGQWGINHVRTAHHLFGEQLKFVCDLDANLAQKVLAISSAIPFTADVNQILNDPSITAVIIATSARTHYPLAKACLLAGKHVLVEKPIALFVDQARELNQLAKRQQKILMVGHILLYHPAIQKIKALITTGKIGKLQYLYSNRLNLGKIRKEENILWSFAPHDISVMQYLVGNNPLAVEAKGGIFLQPGIHDVTLTTMRYPENIHAHIHVSWLHPFKEHRLVIIGDKSMVVFEDTKPGEKLILYPKGFDWIDGEPRQREGVYQVVDYADDEPLRLEQLHFAECIAENKKPLTDGDHGVNVLEILAKAQAQLESGHAPQTSQIETPPVLSEKTYFVHETAIVDDPCEIGEGTKIWHFSHVQSHTTIGQKCVLGQNVNVGNHVKIGNYVKVQNNVSIYEAVELEDYVFCGPSMVFTNVRDPRCEFPQRGSQFYLQTLVKYGASIGANATIVCGHTIGRFAFIAAGAVVTKDVPEYALIAGNPGRIIGWMCRCGERIRFMDDRAICTRCLREYSRENERLIHCTKEVAS